MQCIWSSPPDKRLLPFPSWTGSMLSSEEASDSDAIALLRLLSAIWLQQRVVLDEDSVDLSCILIMGDSVCIMLIYQLLCLKLYVEVHKKSLKYRKPQSTSTDWYSEVFWISIHNFCAPLLKTVTKRHKTLFMYGMTTIPSLSLSHTNMDKLFRANPDESTEREGKYASSVILCNCRLQCLLTLGAHAQRGLL